MQKRLKAAVKTTYHDLTRFRASLLVRFNFPISGANSACYETESQLQWHDLLEKILIAFF
jgi:hypothetical protein